MYKVTCFIQEEKHELFPLLSPLGFLRKQDNQVMWRNNQHYCIIESFSSQGRNAQGYRVYLNGSPDFGEYFFHRAMDCFEPTIRGVEYRFQSRESQHSVVRSAENADLIRGLLYGIYKFKGVGIVILPNGEINFQIRNRKFSSVGLASVMTEIEQAVQVFKPQTFNLFSFLEEDGEANVS